MLHCGVWCLLPLGVNVAVQENKLDRDAVGVLEIDGPVPAFDWHRPQFMLDPERSEERTNLTQRSPDLEAKMMNDAGALNDGADLALEVQMNGWATVDVKPQAGIAEVWPVAATHTKRLVEPCGPFDVLGRDVVVVKSDYPHCPPIDRLSR